MLFPYRTNPLLIKTSFHPNLKFSNLQFAKEVLYCPQDLVRGLAQNLGIHNPSFDYASGISLTPTNLEHPRLQSEHFRNRDVIKVPLIATVLSFPIRMHLEQQSVHLALF